VGSGTEPTRAAGASTRDHQRPDPRIGGVGQADHRPARRPHLRDRKAGNPTITDRRQTIVHRAGIPPPERSAGEGPTSSPPEPSTPTITSSARSRIETALASGVTPSGGGTGPATATTPPTAPLRLPHGPQMLQARQVCGEPGLLPQGQTPATPKPSKSRFEPAPAPSTPRRLGHHPRRPFDLLFNSGASSIVQSASTPTPCNEAGFVEDNDPAIRRRTIHTFTPRGACAARPRHHPGLRRGKRAASSTTHAPTTTRNTLVGTPRHADGVPHLDPQSPKDGPR